MEVIDARLDHGPFRSMLATMADDVGATRWVLLWSDAGSWLRIGTPGTRDALFAALARAAPGDLDRADTADLAVVGPRLHASGLRRLSARVLDHERPAIVFFEDATEPLAPLDHQPSWFSAALTIAGASGTSVQLAAWTHDLVAIGEGRIGLSRAVTDLVEAFGLSAAVFASPAARGVQVIAVHAPDGRAPATIEQIWTEADWRHLVAEPADVLAALPPDRPESQWQSAASTTDRTSLLAVEGDGQPIDDIGQIAELLGQAVARLHAAEAGREQVRLTQRTRLATSLHEELSQRLTAATLEIDLLARRPAAARLTAELAGLRSGVVDAIESLRAAILDLTPPDPQGTRLEAGLERFVESHGAARGVRVDFGVEGEARLVDSESAALVFATVQDALTDVAQHSATPRASVRLAFSPNSLQVVISADAPTELADTSRTDRGHATLQTRAGLFGAKLDVESGTGGGTVVRLEVPTARHQEAVSWSPTH